MMYDQNPFLPADKDRYEIWDMLVQRDVEAFCRQDWQAHEKDFLKEAFFGVHANGSSNPDMWDTSLAQLDIYGKNWQESAKKMANENWGENLKEAIFRATRLRDIEVNGSFALAHKKFDGRIQKSDGSHMILNWQTVYLCRKKADRWWIAGFIGYMPNSMGGEKSSSPAKFAPPSQQHSTAGPYSPVLEVNPGKIVVISGQVGLDLDGQLIDKGFEGQTRNTLANCLTQLKAADCDFRDVFKVMVYLTDLDDWSKFNKIYAEILPEPLPVRTAVQTGLLSDFTVEIEMWAVKS